MGVSPPEQAEKVQSTSRWGRKSEGIVQRVNSRCTIRHAEAGISDPSCDKRGWGVARGTSTRGVLPTSFGAVKRQYVDRFGGISGSLRRGLSGGRGNRIRRRSWLRIRWISRLWLSRMPPQACQASKKPGHHKASHHPQDHEPHDAHSIALPHPQMAISTRFIPAVQPSHKVQQNPSRGSAHVSDGVTPLRYS